MRDGILQPRTKHLMQHTSQHRSNSTGQYQFQLRLIPEFYKILNYKFIMKN